jgi:outer membrane immunogenic protein
MKKVLSFAALAVFAAPAAAADLGGYKDAPAPAYITQWTGFYLGAQIGESVSLGDLAITRGTTSAELNSLGASGFQGVLNAGYDYHFPASKIVAGFWGSYAFGDQTWETTTSTGFAVSGKLNKEWAAGGKAGVIVSPGVLAYAKLGYASSDLDISASFPIPNVRSPHLNGVIAGTGLELALGNGLFANSEYTYTGYSDASIYDFGGIRADISTESHKFLTGLTYKFGGGSSGANGMPGTASYK